MKKCVKYIFLLSAGGLIYANLEKLFRGYTHWTMCIVGGICFVLCGLLNEVIPWEMPIWGQMLICSGVITAVEFAAGCILNLWLGLDIWDYSGMPLNILGQICVPFMILWYFLSFVGIVLDDYMRYWFFDEEYPHYKWRLS